jgi:hypothetical protein
MGYDAVHYNFDNNRGMFVTAGRINLVHAFCMNHHRIAWGILRGALNQVMAGTADDSLVNVLLSACPENTADMLKKFKAALQRAQAKKTLTDPEVTALETVEGEIFSLPLNLFQGLNARADDPADRMDFTPDDITHDGLRQGGVPGDLQKAREQVCGLLLKTKIDVALLKTAVSDWVNLWKAHGGGLTTATPHNAAWWAPGAAPFTNPGYRHWANPSTGTALTAVEAGAINNVVYTRVTTKFLAGHSPPKAKAAILTEGSTDSSGRHAWPPRRSKPGFVSWSPAGDPRIPFSRKQACSHVPLPRIGQDHDDGFPSALLTARDRGLLVDL